MRTRVIILAAGQGTRMLSALPKVLHQLAGRPLLQHVLTTVHSLHLESEPIIICGHQAELIRQAIHNYDVLWVRQDQQCGTGHAVAQALPHLHDDERVLVLCADVPLITTTSLHQLLDITPPAAIGLITAIMPNPGKLGRIIRNDQGHITAIIEAGDASAAILAINEVNSGIYCIPVVHLRHYLNNHMTNNNSASEYYLTDIINYAATHNIPLTSITLPNHEEVIGINTHSQLHQAERIYQQQQAATLLEQGVKIYDTTRLDIRGELNIARDVSIDINVILTGKVTIGASCIIGPNVILRDTTLGEGVTVHANSIIEGATIAANATIGPFARIRPQTEIAANACIGNFVEIKNSSIGTKSKINHLSYIGDTQMGAHVNIGAGTITCNYDGQLKHRTTIADCAFIGSGTQLIAPVTVGTNATIGAGSTITKDAPPYSLSLTRTKQTIVPQWRTATAATTPNHQEK